MTNQEPVYLIFGAYGGVGGALARRLELGGAQLALSGRDPARLAPLATELGALALPADASDFEAVEQAVEQVMDAHGRIDGVASCVGGVRLYCRTVNLPKRRSGLENFCTLFSSEDLTRTKIAPGIRIRPQKR